MIQNRKIQPKDKYQVWWFPATWPEGATPHWEFAGAFEFPAQAFLKKVEIRKEDEQAEIITTQTVDFNIVVANDL